MPDLHIDLKRILLTLQAKRIPFVLTGAHGIATWTGRPRATYDVDILVKGGRNYARAEKALKELYPGLEARRFAGITAFFPPGGDQSLIDLSFPHRRDLEATLQSTVWVEDGPCRYRIPSLEAALANKYGAMMALSRNFVKRGQDAIDFALMVSHSTDQGRQPIDRAVLAELGASIWPEGGAEEILRLVDGVLRGEVPSVTPKSEPGPR